MTAMLKRFRGCMLGGLVGDCLGGPFEGEPIVGKVHLNNYFKQLRDPKKRLPFKPYTDDTAMAKSVALSLVECKGYNAEDMAKRFIKEYFNEPKRGYGAAVHDVFMGLRNSKCEDPYRPAQRQFQGAGSYGNGAAMRVAPVALFFSDEAKMTEVAGLQSKITHYHKLGYQGAILQCLAVRMALNSNSENLDVVSFTDELISRMKEIERNEPDIDGGAEDDNGDSDAPWNTKSYAKRLETVKNFLSKPDPPPMEEIHGLLGVHVSALKSVPTAVYCFLASQNPVPGIETEDKFQRCVQFAISLGGDTDTIASMACAILGAQIGEDSISQDLLRHCEATKDVMSWADRLYEASGLESKVAANDSRN